MDEKERKLRSESKNLKPRIIIGKNGINDEVIKNIKKHIKEYGIIKIKILKTYIGDKDKKEFAKDLAVKCEAKIIDLVGFTVVLSKN
jgi:RNA-binding protein